MATAHVTADQSAVNTSRDVAGPIGGDQEISRGRSYHIGVVVSGRSGRSKDRLTVPFNVPI